MPRQAKPNPTSDRPVTSSSVKFHRFMWFPLLPLELRLHVYTFAAHHPRLIRAHWTSHSDEVRDRSVYEISNFKKPGLLEACRESRSVALKSFDKVPHYIVFHGYALAGRHLWVNFAVDTFFFTNFPDKFGFMRTLRELAKYNRVDKKAGEKGIRNIAWDRKDLWRLLATRVLTTIQTPLIYQMVQDHSALREITVVVNGNSKYVAHSMPSEYQLHDLDKPYADLHLPKVSYEPSLIVPKAFDCSFPMPKGDKEKFEKWKAAHPEWMQPVFTYKKVLKKH